MQLDRRSFVLGSMAAGPLTIIMAGESQAVVIERSRRHAWLETSIREGTEFVSNEWYFKDLAEKPAEGEVVARSRDFYNKLKSYLSECVEENFIENWHIHHSMGGPLTISIDHRHNEEPHTFTLEWPYSTGFTGLLYYR